MNNTYIPKKQQQSKWYLIDAKSQNLGRLSTYIAILLKGKKNIQYTPFINSKTHVIVINSKNINITGQKTYQKTYKKHSGRPGGLKIETFEQLNKRIPNRIIEHSVKGMLPKGILGKQLFRQLKIYSDHNHPHESQKPETITLN